MGQIRGIRKSGVEMDRYRVEDPIASYAVLLLPAYENQFLGRFVPGMDINEVILELKKENEALRTRVSRLEKQLKNR